MEKSKTSKPLDLEAIEKCPSSIFSLLLDIVDRTEIACETITELRAISKYEKAMAEAQEQKRRALEESQLIFGGRLSEQEAFNALRDHYREEEAREKEKNQESEDFQMWGAFEEKNQGFEWEDFSATKFQERPINLKEESPEICCKCHGRVEQKHIEPKAEMAEEMREKSPEKIEKMVIEKMKSQTPKFQTQSQGGLANEYPPPPPKVFSILGGSSPFDPIPEAVKLFDFEAENHRINQINVATPKEPSNAKNKSGFQESKEIQPSQRSSIQKKLFGFQPQEVQEPPLREFNVCMNMTKKEPNPKLPGFKKYEEFKEDQDFENKLPGPPMASLQDKRQMIFEAKPNEPNTMKGEGLIDINNVCDHQQPKGVRLSYNERPSLMSFKPPDSSDEEYPMTYYSSNESSAEEAENLDFYDFQKQKSAMVLEGKDKKGPPPMMIHGKKVPKWATDMAKITEIVKAQKKEMMAYKVFGRMKPVDRMPVKTIFDFPGVEEEERGESVQWSGSINSRNASLINMIESSERMKTTNLSKTNHKGGNLTSQTKKEPRPAPTTPSKNSKNQESKSILERSFEKVKSFFTK